MDKVEIEIIDAEVLSDTSIAAFVFSYPRSVTQCFVVRNISPRFTPDARIPSPTLISFP